MATTPATPAGNQVNLPFSYYRSKGSIVLASTLETRYRTLRENLRSLANWKKHKLCCLLLSIHLLQLHVATERNDVAYSLLLQTTMEPLPHGLLVLSSSKPLTGRTGHQLRDASATGTTGDKPWTYRNLSHYRTRTRCTTTTCLVGYTPLTATPAPIATGTTRHHLANRHLAGDRLRIDSSHHTGHQDYRSCRTSTTDCFLARPTNGNLGRPPPVLTLPNPTRLRPTVYPIWQPTRLCFHYDSCTTQYFRWSYYRCEATGKRCQYHGSIVLQIQFVYSLFLQYTPNY